MRWNVVPVALVGVGIVGWAAFQPGSDGGGDLVVARDRMLASEGLVATFSPGGAEGYRLTDIEGEGWIWERTAGPSGRVLPDAMIWNGSQHLLRVAEGCYIPIDGVREPLVPGWNVAERLVSQPGLLRVGDTRAEYEIDAAPFLSGSQAATVEVTEVLAAVRDGLLTVTTAPGDGVRRVWTGSYEIRSTSAEDMAAARQTLAEASASDFAEVTFMERVTGTLVLSTALLGPYTVVVAEDCPGSPVLLGSAVRGGQVEGLRSAPSPLRFTDGSPPAVQQAMVTRLRIRAPVESFNAEMDAGTFGDVPITEAGVFLVATGGGSGIAVQVMTCTARPWFAC